jgi:hypothetical protein
MRHTPFARKRPCVEHKRHVMRQNVREIIFEFHSDNLDDIFNMCNMLCGSAHMYMVGLRNTAAPCRRNAHLLEP